VPDPAGEWQAAFAALGTSKDSRVRLQAAEALLRAASDGEGRAEELSAAVPLLLSDKDDRVRRLGVALGARLLPLEELEPFLASHIADESYEVRLEAVGQLADLARPQTRSLLATALEDPAYGVRFEAARGMAALQHGAGFDILVQALERGPLRFRALGALAELGDERAIPAIQRLHRRLLLPAFERTQAAGALAKLGDGDAARWLGERVKKKRGADRHLAVELLGEVRAPGAFEQLSAIVEDPADPVRGAAARGLGRLKDLRAEALLERVLRDEGASFEDRLDAAEGLCLLGGQAQGRLQQWAAQQADSAFGRELSALVEDYA
jgi:HEAT repeat protein